MTYKARVYTQLNKLKHHKLRIRVSNRDRVQGCCHIFADAVLIEANKKLQVIRSIKIEVQGDLKALDRLLTEFNRIYQDFIPHRDWLQCRLALAEGFTNAVRHAHQHLSPDIPILIEARLQYSQIEIEIWDYGRPFDLKAFVREMTGKNEDWPFGGRGIPILNQICDRLEYYRVESSVDRPSRGKNCLLMVKKFSDEPAKDTS